MRKITIDRLELRRLRTERNLPHRQFKDGISKRTYNDVEKYGIGTEKMLIAIAKVLGIRRGFAEFLPVRISGEKVRELRLRLNWTREQLAKRCQSGELPLKDCGIDPKTITAETIRQIEAGEPPNGEQAAGSRDLCRRLAAVLKCSFDDLVDDKSSRKPRKVIIGELLGSLSEHWVRRLFESQDVKTGGIRAGLGRDGSLTQPWSTAQALIGALHVTGAPSQYAEELRRGFSYLERRRLPIGCPALVLGPEQEQGWALYDSEKDKPITEITCWVLLAYTYALRAGTIWAPAERGKIVTKLTAEIRSLLRRQYNLPTRHPVGGFCPTVEVCEGNQRTYTTTMALWSLLELVSAMSDELPKETFHDVLDAIDRGMTWLLRTRQRRFGWVPQPFINPEWRPRYHGLNAQILFVLTLLQNYLLGRVSLAGYIPALHVFLADAVGFFPGCQFEEPSANPHISLGDILLEGTPYRLEASQFWWAPWSMALLSLLTQLDCSVGRWEKDKLFDLQDQVIVATHRAMSGPGYGFFSSLLGETLFGISWLGTRNPLNAHHLVNRSSAR